MKTSDTSLSLLAARCLATILLSQAVAVGADGSWYTSFSSDYYNFESEYDLNGGTGLSLARGKKTGSLYGGTLALGLPSWCYEDGSRKAVVEGSFRTGRLSGNVTYTGGPAVSAVSTEWDEAALLVRFFPKFLPFTFDGKAYWSWTIGAKYSEWRTGETLTTPGFIFTSTGNPRRIYKTQAYLGDTSLEYGYYLLHNKEIRKDQTLTWAIRGQANGAGGYGLITGNIADESFVYNLGAKATMVLDYAITNPSSVFTVFAEGGWLYTYWGSSREVQSEGNSIKGPYVRGGVRFLF